VAFTFVFEEGGRKKKSDETRKRQAGRKKSKISIENCRSLGNWGRQDKWPVGARTIVENETRRPILGLEGTANPLTKRGKREEICPPVTQQDAKRRETDTQWKLVESHVSYRIWGGGQRDWR